MFVVHLVKVFAVALAGYLVIALLQALFLELLLAGQVEPGASWGILTAGVVGTMISGLVGGSLIAMVGRERPTVYIGPVLIVLALDTIYVLTNAPRQHLAFNLAGALTLMGATVFGGWVAARRTRS